MMEHDAREYAVSVFLVQLATPNFQGSTEYRFSGSFYSDFVRAGVQDSGARAGRQSRFLLKAWRRSVILEKQKARKG